MEMVTSESPSNRVNAMRLKYIGKQEWGPGVAPLRLWNIICPGHPFHQSTRSLGGLLELGIVSKTLNLKLTKWEVI